MENQYTQPQYINTPPRSLPNATATLVLGIVSIVSCWCIGIVGLTCGIIALYLAYLVFWWVVFGTFFMSNYHDIFRGMQS